MSLAKLKVLVISDTRPPRALVKHILQAADVQVEEADSAPTGLQAWRMTAPDVVLVDLEMPEMTGAAFTCALRSAEVAAGAKRSVVLLISAHTDMGRIKAARQAGVDDVLAKPVSPHKLFERIGAALQRRTESPPSPATKKCGAY